MQMSPNPTALSFLLRPIPQVQTPTDTGSLKPTTQAHPQHMLRQLRQLMLELGWKGAQLTHLCLEAAADPGATPAFSPPPALPQLRKIF